MAGAVAQATFVLQLLLPLTIFALATATGDVPASRLVPPFSSDNCTSSRQSSCILAERGIAAPGSSVLQQSTIADTRWNRGGTRNDTRHERTIATGDPLLAPSSTETRFPAQGADLIPDMNRSKRFDAFWALLTPRAHVNGTIPWITPHEKLLALMQNLRNYGPAFNFIPEEPAVLVALSLGLALIFFALVLVYAKLEDAKEIDSGSAQPSARVDFSVGGSSLPPTPRNRIKHLSSAQIDFGVPIPSTGTVVSMPNQGSQRAGGTMTNLDARPSLQQYGVSGGQHSSFARSNARHHTASERSFHVPSGALVGINLPLAGEIPVARAPEEYLIFSAAASDVGHLYDYSNTTSRRPTVGMERPTLGLESPTFDSDAFVDAVESSKKRAVSAPVDGETETLAPVLSTGPGEHPSAAARRLVPPLRLSKTASQDGLHANVRDKVSWFSKQIEYRSSIETPELTGQPEGDPRYLTPR